MPYGMGLARGFGLGGPQPGGQVPTLQRLRSGYGDVLGTRSPNVRDVLRDYSYNMALGPRMLASRNAALPSMYAAAEREERVAEENALRLQMEQDRLRSETAGKFFSTLDAIFTSVSPEFQPAAVKDTLQRFYGRYFESVPNWVSQQLAQNYTADWKFRAYGPKILSQFPLPVQARLLTGAKGMQELRLLQAQETAASASAALRGKQREAAEGVLSSKEKVRQSLLAGTQPSEADLMGAGYSAQDIQGVLRRTTPGIPEAARLGLPRQTPQEQALTEIARRRQLGPGPLSETVKPGEGGVYGQMTPEELHRLGFEPTSWEIQVQGMGGMTPSEPLPEETP